MLARRRNHDEKIFCMAYDMLCMSLPLVAACGSGIARYRHKSQNRPGDEDCAAPAKISTCSTATRPGGGNVDQRIVAFHPGNLQRDIQLPAGLTSMDHRSAHRDTRPRRARPRFQLSIPQRGNLARLTLTGNYSTAGRNLITPCCPTTGAGWPCASWIHRQAATTIALVDTRRESSPRPSISNGDFDLDAISPDRKRFTCSTAERWHGPLLCATLHRSETCFIQNPDR